MSVMMNGLPPDDCIGRIRFPSVKGLPSEIVMMLHKSLVQLVLLRRSLEMTSAHMKCSRIAICESEELLGRLRADGF